MSNNDDFALYLICLVTVASFLTGSDSVAWIGLLIIIGGMGLWFFLEAAIWLWDKVETRQGPRKKKRD